MAPASQQRIKLVHSTVIQEEMYFKAIQSLHTQHKCYSDDATASVLRTDNYGHRRRKSRGARGARHPIIWEGGQHTLWPPNNPPAFSFNFYVKREKSQMYQVEG